MRGFVAEHFWGIVLGIIAAEFYRRRAAPRGGGG
jgi:hypothetical protein